MLCNGSIHISIYSGIKYSQKVTECKKLYVILRMWCPIKISTMNHKTSSTGRKFASTFHSLTGSPCVISYKKIYRKHMSKLLWEMCQIIRQQMGGNWKLWKSTKTLYFIMWKSLYFLCRKHVFFLGINFYMI